jgi:hypothetical protein
VIKYVSLGIGALIAMEGFKAYGALGQDWNGMLGRVLSVLVFYVIQHGELNPIIMSKGQMGPLQMLSQAFGGKPIDLQLVDPEEMLDAARWGWWCYAFDMVVGLVVWNPLRTERPFQLMASGAVTWGDVIVTNLLMIAAVTFALQECIAFYLRKGGKLPANPFNKKGARHAN